MKYFFILILIFSTGARATSVKSIKNFFNDKTKIQNPFSLRDPFKAPLKKDPSDKKGKGFVIKGKGQYSNIAETQLDQLSVANLKVIGVLIGKERRALVRLNREDKKVIILKEGMKIGPENAELKAILPGGIVLVEKIVNVYGEEEFLETVIPISK